MTLMLTFALIQIPDAVAQYLKELEKQVVELAPKETAVDPAEWETHKTDASITAECFKNQSLTLALLSLPMTPGNEVEFNKDVQLSPDGLNESLERHGYTWVQNVKVTSLAVDSQGGVTGTFEFSGSWIKRGWVEFKAKTEKGRLTLTAFKLPITKVNVVRQADGTWTIVNLAQPVGSLAPADGLYECYTCQTAIGEAPNDVSTVKVKKGDKFLPCPRHKDAWWRSR